AKRLIVIGVYSATVTESLVAIGEWFGSAKRRVSPLVTTAWLQDHSRFRPVVWPSMSRMPTVAPTPKLATGVDSSETTASKYETRILLLPSNNLASKVTVLVPSPLTGTTRFHCTMNWRAPAAPMVL